MDSAQLFAATIRSVSRYKFSAFFAFSLTVLLVLAAIALCPRKFKSEAKLFVRLGRESVTLDPTATTGQTVSVQTSREIEVRSVRDILTSRLLLESVVDSLGPEFILEPPAVTEDRSATEIAQRRPAEPLLDWIQDAVAETRRLAATVGLSDPIPDREQAIRKLEKYLVIDGGSKSSVILVRYVSSSPVAAEQILETFLDSYRSLHVRVNRTPETYAFFEGETDNLRRQLADARHELEQAKNEKNVVAIEVRKQNLQDHISQLDIQIRSVQASLAGAEASLELSENALAELPERLLTDETEGIGDAARDSMRDTLYGMEVEAERVKQAYAEGHPERQRVLAQLESLRQIYDGESKERPMSTSTINPSHQQVQLKVIETKASRASILAELEALRSQRQEVQQELVDLNATEMQLASLQEQVDLLRDNHRQYAENLELSRIDEALGEQRISNVSVVQPPSLVLQPVSPNKKIVGVVGLMLAVFNGVGFSVWRNRHGFATAADASIRMTAPQQPPRRNLTAPTAYRVGDHRPGHDDHDGGDLDDSLAVGEDEQPAVADDAEESWSTSTSERTSVPR
jgi:uncharacterized protein involved in exopolysaccharide biosynthesis